MNSKLELISFAEGLTFGTNDLTIVTNASQLVEGGKYFDIAIFDESSHLDFEDYKDISENTNIFSIAVLDSVESMEKFRDSSKAWILKDNISSLDKLLLRVKDELLMKKELYYTKDGLTRLVVSNMAHMANIDMVKELINQSTTAIARNFESRVNEIREIDSNIGDIMNKINISINKIDGDKEELIKSLDSAKQIHDNMKIIIKSLFSYVAILQCEDRLFQILDGVTSIMKDTAYLEQEEFLNIDREKKEDVLRELVKFYTIQEQRDFALGMKEDDEAPKASELTLF